MQAHIQRVQSWGYDAIAISVQTGDGMDQVWHAFQCLACCSVGRCALVAVKSARLKRGATQLRDILTGQTTVLAGPSGVGKSSIINALRRATMTAEQQHRLDAFDQAMETEFDWKLEDDELAELLATRRRERGGAEASPVVDCERDGGAQSLDTEAVSLQAAWQRRSDDIYGAQVWCSRGFFRFCLVFCSTTHSG